jgi:hypothetical protein
LGNLLESAAGLFVLLVYFHQPAVSEFVTSKREINTLQG